MQEKLAELRRAYYVWLAEMQHNVNVIGVKLQRWSDDLSQRVAECWHIITYWWHSDVQPHFDAAKMRLMGMYNECKKFKNNSSLYTLSATHSDPPAENGNRVKIN